MDTAFMRKTFALIAKGLIEKEQALQKEPMRYPYSKTLQHGLNMFLAASHWAGCPADGRYADEGAFLAHFVTRPVAEWFEGWEKEVIDSLKLEEEAFYACGAFAWRIAPDLYIPTSDCCEFLETQERDLIDGTDEHFLYEKLKTMSQETYCKIRRYIIEHPIITLEERRTVSRELGHDPAALEAFQFAYERVTEESYRCPCCGWTMAVGKYGCRCHSTHCTDRIFELTDGMKLDLSSGDLYRLKKGVMRYFAAPGKLELEIAGFCEKKKLDWSLWPHMDRYDVEIRFSDGEVWAIDAKAYRNPIALRCWIRQRNGFPKGDYDRGYFVIPGEYTANQKNYTTVVNGVLTHQKNVRCITLHTLKREISRKEAACHEK